MITRYHPEDIYKFARDDNENDLRIALNQGENSKIWYRDKHGNLAGHEAARYGHIKTVKILLQYGFGMNSKNNDSETILELALIERHMNIVEMLLDIKSIDINSKNNKGNGVLHFAAYNNLMSIIHLLLRRTDIDINSKNIKGNTALILAAKKGHVNIVEIFLEFDDIDTNISNLEGNTASHLATFYGNFYVLEKLLVKANANINIKNLKNETVIDVAVNRGHVFIFEMLIGRNDIDINSKNDNGDTLLHLAAKKGNINIINILLRRDDINISIQNRNNDSVSHCAAQMGLFSIVEMLLEKGLSINCKGFRGNTVLHVAAESDSFSTIEMLVKRRDLNISSVNDNDETALHISALLGHVNIVTILLSGGIAIDDDIDNYSPDEGTIMDPVDCRPLIFAEVENRRKRALFDTFINHYIEYQPYINSIYDQCYPTGNVQVAKPLVGWLTAETIRDKYYYDEVFFYLHLYIASVYSNIRSNTIFASSSSSSSSLLSPSLRSSMRDTASNSDKTSTLMTILTDRVMTMLKPNQKLAVEVPYVERCNSDNEDNISRYSYDSDYL